MIATRLKSFLFAVATLISSAVFAQETAKGGWENVNGGMMQQPGEGFQASHLVAAAYAFIWVMVAGFVLAMWLRERRLDRDLDELRARIDRAKSASN